MFAKGLLIEDLKDAANFLGRQETWLQTVYIFVNVEHYEDFRNNFYQYEDEASQLISSGKSPAEICEMLYNNHSAFEDKDFILTLRPEDIFSNSKLIVMASDPLKLAICLSEEDDNFMMYKSLITVLNYYNNFLSSIITTSFSSKPNYEGLVESNCTSKNYFWADREIISQRYKSYVSSEGFNKASLEDVLVFHETNIRYLLTGTEHFTVFGGLQYVREFEQYQTSFLNLLEDFVLKLLTVYQACCTVESAKEITTHVRQIIEDANQNDFPMPRLDIKVELNSLNLLHKSLGKEKNSQADGQPGKKKQIKRIQSEQIEQQLRIVEDLIEKHDNEAER